MKNYGELHLLWINIRITIAQVLQTKFLSSCSFMFYLHLVIISLQWPCTSTFFFVFGSSCWHWSRCLFISNSSLLQITSLNAWRAMHLRLMTSLSRPKEVLPRILNLKWVALGNEYTHKFWYIFKCFFGMGIFFFPNRWSYFTRKLGTNPQIVKPYFWYFIFIGMLKFKENVHHFIWPSDLFDKFLLKRIRWVILIVWISADESPINSVSNLYFPTSLWEVKNMMSCCFFCRGVEENASI